MRKELYEEEEEEGEEEEDGGGNPNQLCATFELRSRRSFRFSSEEKHTFISRPDIPTDLNRTQFDHLNSSEWSRKKLDVLFRLSPLRKVSGLTFPTPS